MQRCQSLDISKLQISSFELPLSTLPLKIPVMSAVSVSERIGTDDDAIFDNDIIKWVFSNPAEEFPIEVKTNSKYNSLSDVS